MAISCSAYGGCQLVLKAESDHIKSGFKLTNAFLLDSEIGSMVASVNNAIENITSQDSFIQLQEEAHALKIASWVAMAIFLSGFFWPWILVGWAGLSPGTYRKAQPWAPKALLAGKL